MPVQLAITDGTDTISLLGGDNGLFLNNWRPSVVQPKGGGTFQASALAEGRRLADRRFANAIETFDLKISGLDQDEVARRLQDLRRLLESAVQYWVTAWQGDPVYLVVQASNETNARYAVIHNWSTPDDENPFNNPFLQPDCAAIVDNWTLSIERGHWLELAPESSTCVQVSGQQEGALYTTVVETPTESGDDVQINWIGLSASIAGTNMRMVDLPAEEKEFAIRFRGVAVPNGATITNAFIRLRATDTDAGGTAVLIYIEETDSAGIFTNNFFDFFTHVWRYPVRWDPVPSFTSGNDYDTVDLSWSVQQIVNRVGWVSGNDMAFNFDVATGAAPERQVEAWDHANTNEPELHITYESSTSTFGRAATCDNEVYLANKHNLSQITHIWFWRVAVGYSLNQIGAALPYDLLWAVPAVGDHMYFGVNTAGPNTGPFCSLVFDISTAMADTTLEWEYHDGVGPWVTLTTQDNTAWFSQTGVNSVHWEQPSDWTEVAVNAVTGYWVRARVTAVGAAPAPPEQQNRDPYSILWPSVLVDELQVGGSLPALARIYLKNRSHRDTFPLDDLDTYRVVCGLRSTDRGESFTPYLNISDEQNPTGLTVSRDATDTAAFAADATTPTGRILVDNTTTLNAWVDLVTFTFSNVLAGDFYGTYHAFLRADQDGGSVGDIGYRLKVFYGNTEVVVSETAYFATLNRWQVLDLGTFTYPGLPIDVGDVSESSGLVIQRYATSTTPTAELYDLIIIPTDEWAGDFSPKSEETNDSIQLTNYLDVDSLRPRHNIRALVRDESNDFVLTRWATIANGPATLQPNVDQRLWFFTMELASDGSDELRAPPYQGFSLQLFRNQRYFSYRGDR
jgi:hypothetical protein